MFGTKNREAWLLFLSKAGYSDHLQARRLTPALRDGTAGGDARATMWDGRPRPSSQGLEGPSKCPNSTPSLPTSPRLRRAGRDGMFSVPKRAKQKFRAGFYDFKSAPPGRVGVNDAVIGIAPSGCNGFGRVCNLARRAIVK